MKKTIKVYNMTCSSCERKIIKQVKKLKGIFEVKTNLTRKEVYIDYNSKIVSIEEIKHTIKDLGYSLSKNDKKTFFQAITYGLIPHIGCIMFIIATILGSTVLMNFFKPLLMNSYAFYILILISIGFALISTIIYLHKNNQFNINGIKTNKRYLSIMFGITIGVNLLLFFVIFPLSVNATNITSSNKIQQNSSIDNNQTILEQITLDVDIPCSGHAPLITSELKTLNGIKNIKFDFPSTFTINYDTNFISKEDILNLEVFKSYHAVEVTN